MTSSKLAGIYAMMALTSGMPMATYTRSTPKEKARICPKGCNHYHFNHEGHFIIGETIGIINEKFYAFECFAINDKTAVKKFRNRNKR